MYPEIFNPSIRKYSDRWRRHSLEDVFTCRQCQAVVYSQPMISGVKNRNHCPYCLWSRHVDHAQPGDRMSACKAIMQPIGLTVKRGHNKYEEGTYGELMLIHCCSECDKLSINRIAADDQAERLMEIFRASLGLDSSTQCQLEVSGIHLLQGEDVMLVVSQLLGMTLN
jgi:hypothetical protein